MKKIKILTSIGSLTAIGSGLAIINTGCSSNNDKPTPPLDSKLLITFDYSDADVVAPGQTVTWKFTISYNSTPDTLKKLEVTSSNTKVATVNVPDETKQSFEITGVAAGETDITVKVTDTNDRYNEAKHTIYIAGETVTENDNYVGTVYGTYKINYEITQDDIDGLVPNVNKNIIIAGAEISPEIVTELHIVKVKNDAVLNLPTGFLKGCTNLKKLNLKGIKTTSIQNTYLAKPVIGEFSVNRLEELVVPQIVATPGQKEIVLVDFMSSDGTMPSLKKVDLTGFSKVQRIKGWWTLSRCTALTDVNLEVMTELIEVGVAFMYGCTALKSVNLSTWTKLQVMRNSFMFGCTALESLDLSKLTNLKVIGGEFLKGCTALKTFKFPGDQDNLSALQSIGWDTECNDWAKVYGSFMSGCTSLESIDFSTLDPAKFGGVNKSIEGVDAEFRKDESQKILLKQTIYSSTTAYPGDTQPSFMFLGCNSLAKVNFGELDYGNFGMSSTSYQDQTAFFTKSFETEAEAYEFILNGTDAIQFSGTHADNLAWSSNNNSIFQSENIPIQVGNVFYAREWLPKSIDVVDLYGEPENCTINGADISVDKLTGSQKATVQFLFGFPPSGGTWKVTDGNAEVTGASFTNEGKIGTLTIDSTAVLSTGSYTTWTISYQETNEILPVNQFTLNVKQNNSVRILAKYAKDGKNFEIIESGQDLNFIDNTSKLTLAVKNSDVSEDNMRIVSCIDPNIATLEQSTVAGSKNTAIWSYKSGIGPCQLVFIAVFDASKPNDRPFVTFPFYNYGSSLANWDNDKITCDQTDAFSKRINGGTWTNPASDEEKTLTMKMDYSSSGYNYKASAAVAYQGSDNVWKTDKVTSGQAMGNNLIATFYDGEPYESGTFTPNVIKTTGTSKATTSIIVLYNHYTSYQTYYHYYLNYVLYICNTGE